MTPQRYAAVPGIRTLDFGDEWVIFNPLSWDAHLLNPAAAVVLEMLDTAPQTTGEVAATLGDLLVEEERPAAAAHAERLVAELMQLGLVQPVSADANAGR